MAIKARKKVMFVVKEEGGLKALKIGEQVKALVQEAVEGNGDNVLMMDGRMGHLREMDGGNVGNEELQVMTGPQGGVDLGVGDFNNDGGYDREKSDGVGCRGSPQNLLSSDVAHREHGSTIMAVNEQLVDTLSLNVPLINPGTCARLPKKLKSKKKVATTKR